MIYTLLTLGLLIRDADWDREWDCPKGHRLAEDLEMIEVCVFKTCFPKSLMFYQQSPTLERIGVCVCLNLSRIQMSLF